MSKKEKTVQDLINDASFRRLVLGTANDQDIIKWDRWIEDSEENRKVAKEARARIAGFQFSEPTALEVEEEWKKLSNETVKKNKRTTQSTNRQRNFWKWPLRVASIVFLAALTGIAFYSFQSKSDSVTSFEQIIERQSVNTGDGENKIIRFNNGAKIFLNSNSKITYTLNPEKGEKIEVVVEGEVFFDSGEKVSATASVFEVNTPDGVISDIGTSFLVTVLRDRSRVVLEDGDVEVNMENSLEGGSVISMVPGDLLEFNESQVVNKQKVNPSFYTSWATGVMKFEETTIREFVKYVEGNFEVDILIVDKRFADIKLTGGIYFRSLEELVRAVSEIASVPIYQSADRKTVYIGDGVSEDQSKLKTIDSVNE